MSTLDDFDGGLAAHLPVKTGPAILWYHVNANCSSDPGEVSLGREEATEAKHGAQRQAPGRASGARGTR